MELFVFSFELDDNDRLSFGSFLNFEGPVFHIRLDNGIIEFPADESLGIKNGVMWIFSGLIFGRITDESLSFGEGDIRWSGSVTLIIGDDLNSVILPDSNTGVSGSEIDSDGFGSVAH
jgi:hypothetical protein